MNKTDSVQEEQQTNYLHVDPDGYMCLNGHPVTYQTEGSNPWPCGDPNCEYYDGVTTPTPQPAVGDEELRKIVEDSIRHARMNAVMVERFDAKVAEENILLNVETIMVAIETNRKSATERAEVEGALKSLNAIWDDYAPGNLKSPIIKALAAHIELLEQRLHTLSKAKKEKEDE